MNEYTRGRLEALDDATIHDLDAMSLTEKAERDEQIAADDAFVARLLRAAKRGRETVTPGVFVDTTPPVRALRLRGEAPMTVFGSPAAMCAEVGSGTES